MAHSHTTLKQKPVAVAILPREGFSFVPQCLEVLYKHTPIPIEVAFFEGRADSDTRLYLEQFAKAHPNFTVIYSDTMLGQAESRNLAAAHFYGHRFLVLMENEIIVRDGWLENMLRCAEEEQAAIVAPLVMFTLNERIHSAGGGLLHISERDGKKIITEEIFGLEEKPNGNLLKRRKIDYPEIHCILIDRTKLHIEPLFDTTVETLDIDFGMTLLKNNITVFYEPQSVVYLPFPLPLRPIDYDYFTQQWNYSQWEAKHLNFQRKWNSWPEENHKKEFYQSQQRLVYFARLFGPNTITLGITNTYYLFKKRLGSYVKDLLKK